MCVRLSWAIHFLARGHYFLWWETFVLGPLTTVLQYNHCDCTIDCPNYSLLTIRYMPSFYLKSLCTTLMIQLRLSHHTIFFWTMPRGSSTILTLFCLASYAVSDPSHPRIQKTSCRHSRHLVFSLSLSSTLHRFNVTKCCSILRHVRVPALHCHLLPFLQARIPLCCTIPTL